MKIQIVFMDHILFSSFSSLKKGEEAMQALPRDDFRLPKTPHERQ